MSILDGKKISEEIASELKEAISILDKKPLLVIIQIGEVKASNVYIKRKINFAEKIGAKVFLQKFDTNVSETELIDYIKKQNTNDDVHGIIVQLPIPEKLNLTEILNSIDPKKDVDGLGQGNIYGLIKNAGVFFVPATTRGVITLLKKHNIKIEGKNVVIIGRSLLVGKTMALNFLNHNATVTVCHKETDDLKKHTKIADILVVATGQPGLIDSSHTHKDQVVVDVGISVVDGRIVGDVKGGVSASFVSPVPGGVGPMTVASLFENLLQAHRIQSK